MKDTEIALIALMKQLSSKGAAAILLQSYIQVNGPVTNEAGDEIKEILRGMRGE